MRDGDTLHETLGIPPGADPSAIRRTMTRLALIYHPDTGGSQAPMTRINAAYETACASPEDG
jgi:curved DNA-binding protein CbpA